MVSTVLDTLGGRESGNCRDDSTTVYVQDEEALCHSREMRVCLERCLGGSGELMALVPTGCG